MSADYAELEARLLLRLVRSREAVAAIQKCGMQPGDFDALCAMASAAHDFADALADLRKQRDEACETAKERRYAYYLEYQRATFLEAQLAEARAEMERLKSYDEMRLREAVNFKTTEQIAALIKAKDRWQDRAEAAEHRADRYKAALEDIARQNLTSEMPEPDEGDFIGAYEECIRVARAALSPPALGMEQQ